ncbi:MAG: hypothetical protein SFX72_05875 [Isosphaeraceae bacterium]|nr:hypothetical protein [Isosphaeraceae bacterium]
MSVRSIVIIHERIAHWHRRLRPRFLSWDAELEWAETRSAADLSRRVLGIAHPVILVDAADWPAAALEAVGTARYRSPGASILVLDALDRAGFAPAAREVGATEVISGAVRVSEIFAILVRWTEVARVRTAGAGWSAPRPQIPEPWEDPTAFATRWFEGLRWSGL